MHFHLAIGVESLAWPSILSIGRFILSDLVVLNSFIIRTIPNPFAIKRIQQIKNEC